MARSRYRIQKGVVGYWLIRRGTFFRHPTEVCACCMKPFGSMFGLPGAYGPCSGCLMMVHRTCLASGNAHTWNDCLCYDCSEGSL